MNNKKVVLSIGYMILLCAFAQAQGSSSSSSLSAKLEATTSIRQQSACLSGSDMVQVNFALNVKFTNVGNYPAIIAKNSGIWAGDFIAHTEEMANSGKYEYKLLGDIFEFPFVEQADSPGDSYVILKPNEKFDFNSSTGLFLKYPKEYEHYSQAAHFLRIGFLTMDTNFITPDGKWVEGKESRAHWKKYGDLLFGVSSQPMRIELPQAGSLSKCQ